MQSNVEFFFVCTCVCVCDSVCMCSCVYVDLNTCHALSPHVYLRNGQAPELGAEEVRGKLIDEDLEPEER